MKKDYIGTFNSFKITSFNLNGKILKYKTFKYLLGRLSFDLFNSALAMTFFVILGCFLNLTI